MKEMTKWSRPGNKVADCTPSIKAYSEIVSGSDSAERRSGLLIVSAKGIKQHSLKWFLSPVLHQQDPSLSGVWLSVRLTIVQEGQTNIHQMEWRLLNTAFGMGCDGVCISGSCKVIRNNLTVFQLIITFLTSQCTHHTARQKALVTQPLWHGYTLPCLPEIHHKHKHLPTADMQQ